MKLGITGTYSSGKTLTAMALSYYTGVPRTQARTMREILPEAAPGKTLEECTFAELLQMIVVRHTDRVKYEYALGAGSFISDGCSLQEWIYGALRVKVGINPNDSAALGDRDVEKTAELAFFEQVMHQLGVSFKLHVKQGFDAFVHLRNELPLAKDGHRPVNDRFRTLADQTLLRTLDELKLPVHVVSGTVEERLVRIAQVTGFAPVTSPEEAAELARRSYSALDTRGEAERLPVAA